MSLKSMKTTDDALSASDTIHQNLESTPDNPVHIEAGEVEYAYSTRQTTKGVAQNRRKKAASDIKSKQLPVRRVHAESDLNEICRAFGLTMEELAQILKLPNEKTLTDWIEGKTKLGKDPLDRKFNLLVAARGWRKFGYTSDREKLLEPILHEGLSVIDLLNDSEIDRELIHFAGSRLYMMYLPQKPLPDPFGKFKQVN